MGMREEERETERGRRGRLESREEKGGKEGGGREERELGSTLGGGSSDGGPAIERVPHKLTGDIVDTRSPTGAKSKEGHLQSEILRGTTLSPQSLGSPCAASWNNPLSAYCRKF